MAVYEGCVYDAHIDVDPEAAVECDDCGWVGKAGEMDEIQDCALDPSDPSPAGRCPNCGTLVYP